MKMPFGRYKGVELADLPLDYLGWLRGIGDDLREPLRSAVEKEWQDRHAPPPATIPPDLREMAGELIASCYRTLAKTHHPDLGGDGRAMVLVNAAMTWLRQVVRTT
jgi:hypothetical protein